LIRSPTTTNTPSQGLRSSSSQVSENITVVRDEGDSDKYSTAGCPGTKVPETERRPRPRDNAHAHNGDGMTLIKPVMCVLHFRVYLAVHGHMVHGSPMSRLRPSGGASLFRVSPSESGSPRSCGYTTLYEKEPHIYLMCATSVM
jgi:hypothetical protein